MKTDSDSEENSEPEVSVRFSHGLTRSVFNITLDLPDEAKEDIERTEYEKRLNAEIAEWWSLLKETRKAISNPTVPNTIDLSVLSDEKLDYLKRAQNLNEFVENTIEFRKEAEVYLQDYAEILAMHENLTELCKNCLGQKKMHLIENYLYNNKKRRQK